MRLSVNVPNFGDLPDRHGLGVMASAAESAGADGIWLADHVLMIDEVMTGYPYTADGIFSAPATFPFLDSLVSAAFVAAATKRCRIGIGVLVLPQRNVLELAKIAASIDRLTGGRFVLGVGTGWNKGEMEALGYSFAKRGQRMNEMMQVLRTAWTGSPEAFDGQEVKVRDKVKLFPRPAQEAGVPMIVGGMADIVLQRAARLGDGWLAIGDVATLDIETLRAQMDRLRSLRAEAGGGPFEMVMKLEAEVDPSLFHHLPETVAKLAELGFDETVIDVPWEQGIDEACAMIRTCSAATR